MSEQFKQQPQHSLNISGSILESVQIGGIAGRDLEVNQFQNVGVVNVYGPIGS